MGKAKTTRGSILQRAPLSRTVIVTYKDPGTGRRKQVWETVRGQTEKEAQRTAEKKLTELLSKLDVGLPAKLAKETLADWLESWLRDIVAIRNAPMTLKGYREIVRNHIVPAIGWKQLKDVHPCDVDGLLAAVIRPVSEGGKGLSANMARHVYIVLHKAIKDAIRKGKLYRNVCEMVDAPSPGKYRADIPPAEIISKVLALAWAHEPDLAPLFQFSAFTGVRRAEACGLRWENVDLSRKVVAIRESVQRLAGKGLIVQPPKNERSRGIALDESTVSMLREHQGTQLLRKAELGTAYQDHGIVFADPLGGYYDPDHVTHVWKRLRDQAGYAGLKLHGLRHAHAAGMIRADVHAKVVQERLGHASAAFTLDVYGHVSPGLQERAAERFAAMMKAASEQVG